MLHYTAVCERMLMKAPVFSSSLDDMKAVSHFYTSPLLPLWPLPPRTPTLQHATPCLPSDNRRQSQFELVCADDGVSQHSLRDSASSAHRPPAASASPIDQRTKRGMFFYAMPHWRRKALCCLATGSALCLSPLRQMLRMNMVPE